MTNIDSLKDNNCVLWYKGNAATANAPKTITANGNVTQILPFPGAGIAMFDEAGGDSLRTPLGNLFSMGSSNFTFELLFKTTNSIQYTTLMAYNHGDYGSSGNWTILFGDTSGTPQIWWDDYSSSAMLTSSSSGYNDGKWHHLAWVRSENNHVLYLDGLQKATVTSSISMTSARDHLLAIGGDYTYSRLLNGSISEVRISDIARYIGQFTPPMHQLSNDANTKLLLHFNTTGTTFTDYSPSAHTITPYGNATQICSPCGSGVAYFDGAGDFLSTNVINFAGDFTIYFWMYVTSIDQYDGIIGGSNGSDSENGWTLGFDSTTTISFDRYINDAHVYGQWSGTFLNTWVFVKIYRSGTSLNAVINGIPGTPVTMSGACNGNTNLIIGRRHIETDSRYFNGYLSEIKIIDGIADTSTSVITQPFKPDPYTKLLLHMDGTTNAFYDASDAPGDNGFPILPDGVSITANGSFVYNVLKDNSKCLVFDGSTNYVSLSDHDAWSFWDSDFTIAVWFKVLSISNPFRIITQQVNSDTYAQLFWHTDNKIYIDGMQSGSRRFEYTMSLTPNIGIWYYIAIIRSGSTYLMYLYGSSQPTTILTAWNGTNLLAAPFEIGGLSGGINFINGSIKDLMIFKKALTIGQIGALMDETFIY
jgi:hypothetical protein